MSFNHIDYQINVMSKTSLLQTLAFTVYGPNNIDRERQMNWDYTPDKLSVQPGWENITYAFRGEAMLWASRFPKPIVAVFDVVTSNLNTNAETHPVLLLQPRPRLEDLFPTRYQKLTGIEGRTVVGRIGNSLFAMGNVNFPLVNIAQLPDTVLFIDPAEDKGKPNALSTATRCRDLFCLLGVRLTKQDDASSRLSRLLDSPERLYSKAMVKRDEGPRGEGEQERIGGRPTASKVVLYTTHAPSPSRNLLGGGGEAPSSLGTNPVGVVANQAPFPPPPTDATAHNWTLLIPFVGGFIAVWLLLRKFIRISDHVPKRFRERGLIQPLQRDSSRPRLLPPPQETNGVADVGGEPKELPVPPAYSVHAEPGQPIASSSRVRLEDLPVLSEKIEVGEEVPMQVVSVPPAASAEEGGEGSEKDEEDEDEAKAGGKKKKIRRKRGGKKKGAQRAIATSQPADEIADDYVQVARPPAPTTPITSEPSPIANMSLPMPVTHSPASLVVTSNILGEHPISPRRMRQRADVYRRQAGARMVRSSSRAPSKGGRWP
jgi:serine/threonine-protein kinase/endoribonuclease IRE1